MSGSKVLCVRRGGEGSAFGNFLCMGWGEGECRGGLCRWGVRERVAVRVTQSDVCSECVVRGVVSELGES